MGVCSPSAPLSATCSSLTRANTCGCSAIIVNVHTREAVLASCTQGEAVLASCTQGQEMAGYGEKMTGNHAPFMKVV